MREKETVLCSILLAAYNAEQSITATVESLLRQTHSAIEILIANDASTDGTRRAVSALIERDSRIQATHLRKHRGTAGAYNLLAERAKGEYVAFVESGDIWFADKLERQLALLEKHEADLVYSSYSCINAAGAVTGAAQIVPEECTFTALVQENFIHPSTVVMKSAWAEAYSWDDSYAESAYVYWLTLLQEGALAVGSQEVLIDHRVDQQSSEHSMRERIRNRWQLYRHFLSFTIAQSLWHLILSALRSLQRKGAGKPCNQ